MEEEEEEEEVNAWNNYKKHLEVRVGYMNPNYEIGDKAHSPYYTNKWINLSLFRYRLTEVNKIHEFLLHGVSPYYKNDIENNDGKEYKRKVLREVRDNFPYFLLLFEFRFADLKRMYPWKFIGLFDIEKGGENSMNETFEYLDERKFRDKFSNNPLSNLSLENTYWFTGGKGLRLVKTVDPDGSVSTSKLDDLFIYTGLPKKVYNEELEKKLEKILPDNWSLDDFGNLLDKSIYVPGHGVKADLLPHPKTCKLPKCFDSFAGGEDLKLKNFEHTYEFGFESIVRSWLSICSMAEQFMKKIRFSDPFGNLPLMDEQIKSALDCTVPRSVVKNNTKDVQLSANLKNALNGAFNEFKCTFNLSLTSGGELLCFNNPYCHIHQKEHSEPSKIYYILPNIRSTNILAFCHSSSDYTGGLLLPLHPKLHPNTFIAEQTSNDGIFYNELLTAKLIHHGTYLQIDRKYLEDILENSLVKEKKIVCIRSRMGSGKTQVTASYLNQNTNMTTSRVGASSPRICFANSVAATWKLKCYSDLSDEKQFEKNLAHYNRIVISMESIDKLVTPGTYNIKPFDVWILDESETLLGVFNSSTMDKKRVNFLTLINILKATKKRIFIMDALMGPKTINFLKTAGLLDNPNDYIFIDNIYKNNDIKYELLLPSEWDIFIQNMFHDLMNGRRIAFVCDSNKQILKILNQLINDCSAAGKKFDWMLINGASSNDVKRTSVDCSTWGNYQLLAYTPAITVGNSCTEPFWKTYGLYYGVVNSHTFLQMMERIRTLDSKKRVIFVDTSNKRAASLVQNKNDIEEMLRKKDLNIQQEAKYLLSEGFTCLDDPFISLPNPHRCLKELFLENCYQDIKSETDPMGELRKSLRRQHSEWYEVEGSDKNKNYQQFKKIKLEAEKVDDNKLRVDGLRRRYLEQVKSYGFTKIPDDLSTSDLEEIIKDHLDIKDFQLPYLYKWEEYVHSNQMIENLFVEELDDRIMAVDTGNLATKNLYFLFKSLGEMEKAICTNYGHMIIIDLFSVEKDKDLVESIHKFFDSEEITKIWNFDAKVRYQEGITEWQNLRRRLNALIMDCFAHLGILYQKVPDKLIGEFLSKNSLRKSGILVAKTIPSFRRNLVFYLPRDKYYNSVIAAYANAKKLDSLPIHLKDHFEKSVYKKFLIQEK